MTWLRTVKDSKMNIMSSSNAFAGLPDNWKTLLYILCRDHLWQVIINMFIYYPYLTTFNSYFILIMTMNLLGYIQGVPKVFF